MGNESSRPSREVVSRTEERNVIARSAYTSGDGIACVFDNGYGAFAHAGDGTAAVRNRDTYVAMSTGSGQAAAGSHGAAAKYGDDVGVALTGTTYSGKYSRLLESSSPAGTVATRETYTDTIVYGDHAMGGTVRTQGSAVAGIVDSSGFFVEAGRAHIWSVDGEVRFDTSKGGDITISGDTVEVRDGENAASIELCGCVKQATRRKVCTCPCHGGVARVHG